ncbi:C163A protein, partial [Alaudala cheleensis]|nr:C163A protein [Alaudala cheleensis]
LRLVGGGERCAGRVEVKHGGQWGSVCVFDFDWDARWAIVVCRQLGCGRVAKASPYAPFGQGTGRIWLHPFFCAGSEDTLVECPHLGWGRHFCGHDRDVGVICTDSLELRLAGGDSPCAGRVEVKLRGQWGSVRDDNWDMEDAEVVCQHLGCGSASGAYTALDRFGVGEGPVSLVLVDCSGHESTFWDCEIRGWGPYAKITNLDTAVVCQGFSRLVGGDGACAGQLEVRQGKAWVGVCEDQVDMKVAQVVCRELGCGVALAIPGSGRFAAGSGSGSLWDGGFQCNGTEPLLSACARRPPHGRGCTGPASVICSPYTGFRLGNSSSGCTGRVEVAVRGTWGSVCASEWDLPDAEVLCRHLGCGHAFTVPPGGSFGSGKGPLRPDAFGCSGSERHPGECPVAVLGEPPCAPGNAAAVNCSGDMDDKLEEMEEVLGLSPAPNSSLEEMVIVCSSGCPEKGPRCRCPKQPSQPRPSVPAGSRWVRLVGSSGRCAGRVEVYSGGTWSSVCQEGWELQDAAVVCRELGCGRALEAPSSAQRFGAGTGPLWPYIPDCSGSEESLWEC